jgi:anthranilate synthase component 2
VILVIDNYDSFTYNLVQLLGRMVKQIHVARNDRITLEEVERLAPERILISPGPGRPEDAGITVELIREFGPRRPTLGVCLGHQAIGLAFGGTIVHAPSLMHGRTSVVRHTGGDLYRGVENPFTATRYHSLVIAPQGFPEELEVTSRTEDGVIMGVRHRRFPVEGVQFHPESILTECGEQIMRNWLTV